MARAVDEGIQKLYHYESFNPDYLKDTLINNRVHFSNPANFNDPWDCRPWFDPSEVFDPFLRSQWVRFLEPHVTAQEEAFLRAQGIDWRSNTKILTSTIEKMTATMWQLNTARWRIYCLTPHPTSLLMWSHYGDKHRGICLEFDATIPVIGRAFKVTYQESLSAITASFFGDWGAMASMLRIKSSVWAYEDEYRVLARDAKADDLPPDFLPVTDGDFLSLPRGTLKAVIAGCNADFGAIHTIVKENAPDVRFKRCIRPDDRYSLSIEEYAA